MNRFIIPAGCESGARVELSPDEAAHATRVMRLNVGEAVELIDGVGGKWRGVLVEVKKDSAAVELGERLPSNEPDIELTLIQGVPKFEKLELVVQKATELGAARLIPVTMERSIVRLNEKDAQRRRERLARIALEAAKQCGRARVPEILPFMSWEKALSESSKSEIQIMPWEEAHERTLSGVHAQAPSARSIAVFIGPEGGISLREAEDAAAQGVLPVTLGPRILRTETAAIAALALVMGYWGDIR